MSGRTPLNEPARRRVAAEASAESPGPHQSAPSRETSLPREEQNLPPPRIDGLPQSPALVDDGRPSGEWVRKPFGGRRQKLAYPSREGYHRHWFNDDLSRILEAKDAGYDHVLDQSGKPVSMVVGVGRGGHPLVAYLMQTPIEWFEQDKRAQDAVVLDLMHEIGRADFMRPGGRDGDVRYGGSGKGDIKIESGIGRR